MFRLRKLEDANLYEDLNLIITSDHGMTGLEKDKIISLDDYNIRDLVDMDHTYTYDNAAGIRPINESARDIIYEVI